MTKKWMMGLTALLLIFAAGVGSVWASPSHQVGDTLTVQRSDDRLSATATWTPNPGAVYQAFYIAAKLRAGEEDTTGKGIVPGSSRYVDYPQDGDVDSLVLDGLDAGRDYFYFVTSIARDSSGEWGAWSPWQRFSEHLAFTTAATDREALVALYNMTDGANWRTHTNWLSGAPIGDWYGVKTDDGGRVEELNLWLNKLDGQIPPELGNLARLERLNLLLNRLNGEIPAELGMLSNLKELILTGNQLTGEIPSGLGGLMNLEKLHLSLGNQFTGCIPSNLQNVAVNDLSELVLPFCS